jgi:RNA polymerase sigma factor (sigma-70 family)
MTALEGKALLDHGKAIARRYAGRVGSETAEELRAEAVMRALRSPPPDGRIEPWFERIYRNLLVDWWRRIRPTADIADLDQLASGPTPEEQALRHERRRVVRASLGSLPREARRALLSRFYGELDDHLAATRFGISPTTVRTRIHRALAHLRVRLGDLRAWFPPLLGKLGAQAAAVGVAPVMVAALVVVGSAGGPAPETAALAPPMVAHPSAPAARLDARESKPAPVTLAATPTARAAKKAAPHVAIVAPPESPTAIAVIEDVPVIGQVLEPDGLDVFAEPDKPQPPCLVEAPPELFAQIEKMIEERL